MTVLGKTLVFVNLVFSLVVAALIVLAYAGRTNWHAAYDQEKRRADAASASAETYRADYEKEHADFEAAKQAQVKELEAARRQVDVVAAQVKDVQGQLEAERRKGEKGTLSLTSGQAEVQRLSEYAKKLEGYVADLTKRLEDQVKEKNDLRQRAVAAEIENKGLKDRLDQLARVVEDQQKDLVRIKAAGGVSAQPVANVKNPPPENVEGLIKAVDSGSGLVTLTIGSDSGILKGHTLEVYRLSPTPKYLGTIRVLDSKAHEAVGKPLSGRLGPIQVGDRVASKIQ